VLPLGQVRRNQREGRCQHLIQVHTRKLLQPLTPGKVTKRGPLSASTAATRSSASASRRPLGTPPPKSLRQPADCPEAFQGASAVRRAAQNASPAEHACRPRACLRFTHQIGAGQKVSCVNKLAGSSCAAARSLAGRPVALASSGEALELPVVHIAYPLPAGLSRWADPRVTGNMALTQGEHVRAVLFDPCA